MSTLQFFENNIKKRIAAYGQDYFDREYKFIDPIENVVDKCIKKGSDKFSDWAELYDMQTYLYKNFNRYLGEVFG